MQKLNEKQGYVQGLSNFIKYVLSYLENISKRIIRQERRTDSSLYDIDDRIVLKRVFRRHILQYGEDNFKNIVPSIILSKTTLEKLGIYGIEKFRIDIYANLESGGAFNQYESSLKEDGNGWNELSISVNIVPFIFSDRSDVATTIQHEMTHAYEYAKQVRQKGEDWADNGTANKYYTTSFNKQDIVKRMSYIFSQSERNANISSLYTFLEYNNATEENYRSIVEKSDYYVMLINMEDILNKIKTNEDNCVNQIIDWIKKNQEHVDMFPSIKNKSLIRYQRRLITALSVVIEKFKEKGNRIIKLYLKNKATV